MAGCKEGGEGQCGVEAAGDSEELESAGAVAGSEGGSGEGDAAGGFVFVALHGEWIGGVASSGERNCCVDEDPI